MDHQELICGHQAWLVDYLSLINFNYDDERLEFYAHTTNFN